MISDYLKYRRARVNQYGLHSPFMYRFYLDVIRDRKKARNQKVEGLRNRLCKNKTRFNITDLGAGSRKTSSSERSISEVAKNAAISSRQAEILSRLIQVYDINRVLELGTSLGIGTSYFATARNGVEVVTIEGCPQTAKIAAKNFEQMGIKNVVQKVGPFVDVLPSIEDQVFDLIYIDGNHRLAPTLAYFEWALNHIAPTGFIVLDDINWSDEMKQAWRQIKADERIHVSMDFFRFGILSKREEQEKQNFILKY